MFSFTTLYFRVPRRPVLPGTVPFSILVSQCPGNLLPGRPFVPFFFNSTNSIFSFILFLSRLGKTNQRRGYMLNISHCITSRETLTQMTGRFVCTCPEWKQFNKYFFYFSWICPDTSCVKSCEYFLLWTG